MNRMHGIVCSSGWWGRRLGAAGLAGGEVHRVGRSFRFRARKPVAVAA